MHHSCNPAARFHLVSGVRLGDSKGGRKSPRSARCTSTSPMGRAALRTQHFKIKVAGSSKWRKSYRRFGFFLSHFHLLIGLAKKKRFDVLLSREHVLLLPTLSPYVRTVPNEDGDRAQRRSSTISRVKPPQKREDWDVCSLLLRCARRVHFATSKQQLQAPPAIRGVVK